MKIRHLIGGLARELQIKSEIEELKGKIKEEKLSLKMEEESIKKPGNKKN